MKNIFIPLLCLLSFGSYAQQETQYSCIWKNISQFNPSQAGQKHDHYFNSTLRAQWTGIDGHPITFYGNYEKQFESIRSGIGVSYINDELGFEKKNQLLLNLSHSIPVKDYEIWIGAGVSALQQTIAANWITPWSILDPSLPQNGTHLGLTFNAGTSFKSEKINAGFGITQNNEPYYSTINYYMKNHMYAHIFYKLIDTDLHDIDLGGLFKRRESFNSFDFGIRYTYDDFLWSGINYRTGSAIDIQTGFLIAEKFSFAYSLGYTVSQLQSGSIFSHEIHLGFQIN